MKKYCFQVIKICKVFYFIGIFGVLISSCGGSSSSATPTPSPTPTTSSDATVKCATGQLCPPSNVSIINAR